MRVSGPPVGPSHAKQLKQGEPASGGDIESVKAQLEAALDRRGLKGAWTQDQLTGAAAPIRVFFSESLCKASSPAFSF